MPPTEEPKVVNMFGKDEHVSPVTVFKNALEEMLEIAPLIKEQYTITAPLLFDYYLELQKAGFTKEQAFEFIKFNGYLPK